MTEKKANVLVVGGAGYIGSHTCKALSEKGYTPITYDNLIYGHSDCVRWGPFEEGDIRDNRRLLEVIHAYLPEAVIHFAAFTYVGESVTDPSKYYGNNVLGTLSLLEAMRAGGIDKIVFSSTCAVYGKPGAIPITEKEPLKPINPYGRTKRMIEEVLSDFSKAYGLKSAALRYFNAAGADPDGESGEHHDPETHLIPRVLDVALGRSASITVFGDDYDTPDGTCIRDYIHVTDLASAHIAALESLVSGTPQMALNLGNGQGYSVMEVIQSVQRVTGRNIPHEIGPRREGDPPKLLADASAAGELLDWTPRYRDIDTIVEHAWRWHKKCFGTAKG